MWRRPGSAPLLLGVFRDATARRELERSLRVNQFSTDHAGDSIFWVGPDAVIQYANASRCQLSSDTKVLSVPCVK